MNQQRNPEDFLVLLTSIARVLNKLGLPYAITGGYAVSVWGRPRSTLDIDSLLALTPQDIDRFIEALRGRLPSLYVDRDMIVDAMRQGGEFNVIEGSSGVKIDFWVVRDARRRSQLRRRISRRIKGVEVYFLAPEDLILSKLDWYQRSLSQRHLEDVESVFAISGDLLDTKFLVQEAKDLGVEELMARVSKQGLVPSMNKVAPFERLSFSYAVVAERGTRPSMEDRHVVADERVGKGWWYGGVYDGHGGVSAAEYARAHLHKEALALLDKGSKPDDALRIAYEEVSRGIREPNVGTCALDVIFYHGALHHAHAGDSRLVLVRDKGIKQMTRDHRVTNGQERRRIGKLGGTVDGNYIVKGEFALMPTRALGDSYFHDAGVITAPEMGEYRFTRADRWVIAATDGLFDAASNHEIAELLRPCKSADQAAERLRKYHAKRGGEDNMTAVVIKMNKSSQRRGVSP